MVSIDQNARSNATNPLAGLADDEQLKAQIAAAEKQKRKLNIPRDVPEQLYAMLRTTAMHVDAGNVVDEAKARQDVINAWVNLNKDVSDNHAFLFDLGAATGLPAMLLAEDFRPESVKQAVLRHLRELRTKNPKQLKPFLLIATERKLVTAVETAQLL